MYCNVILCYVMLCYVICYVMFCYVICYVMYYIIYYVLTIRFQVSSTRRSVQSWPKRGRRQHLLRPPCSACLTVRINRPFQGFRRHLGGGAVAAKIIANVWEIVQLSNLVTPLLYNGVCQKSCLLIGIDKVTVSSKQKE